MLVSNCNTYIANQAAHVTVKISEERNKCIKRHFPNTEERRIVMTEYGKFSENMEEFGGFDSLHERGFLDPKIWWVVYGSSMPRLQQLALKLLGQALYFLIVNVLRRQRLLRDPEVMTSYRELSKKAQKANNLWWRLSGLLGDQNRLFMYIVLQATFTVATMALTVPIFLSYELHFLFQVLKVSASIWNGGSFLLEVMPRQVVLKEKKKTELQPVQTQQDQSSVELENSMKAINSAKTLQSS